MYTLIWYSIGSVSAWLFLESENVEKNAKKLFRLWSKNVGGKYAYSLIPGSYNYDQIREYKDQKGGSLIEIEIIDYNGIKIVF